MIPSLDMVIVRMGVVSRELVLLTDGRDPARDEKRRRAHRARRGQASSQAYVTDEPLTEDVMIALIAALAALWTLLRC